VRRVEPPEIDVVLVNAPPEHATHIARALVEQRLAACVNVIAGVTSIYRWEGAIHEDSESTLLIKTRRDLLDDLKAAIAAIHPYSLPEVLVLPVSKTSSRAYLDWVSTETRGAK
jgi:periplasmic divalent cation tolerance protein